jgi:4-diphosphocytidyl-2-C-methyl-D-erythritol kinase
VTVETPAKINLALLVGSRRPDGKHEVVTVLEHVALFDTISVLRAPVLRVEGFDADTLVRDALSELAAAAGTSPGFAATIVKRIPVASGLGGGSSDAAAALRLGNEQLDEPLSLDALHVLAARLGADVPFFLRQGAHVGTEDGSVLTRLALPTDYHVVVWLPDGAKKTSTADVYEAHGRAGRADGFGDRCAALEAALAGVRRAEDLARLPANDLARSASARELVELGAFRADVSGAGPALYGLFSDADAASRAASKLGAHGEAWLTQPCWYG